LTNALDTLSYAARPRVVLKYLGQAGLVLAGLQCVPAAVALGTGDYAIGITELALGLALAVACLPLARLAPPQRVLAVEALAVVALAFVFASLLLWLPMRVAGLRGVDALFEAVSAVTTTGLTTLRSVEALPKGLLFLRSWAQWYGGLGIIAFVLALLANHPAMARRLMDADSSQQLVTTTRSYARTVATIYVGLTAGGIALLLLAGADPLLAVTHALSAVSTGGFSTFDASLRGFDNTRVWLGVALISLCGAVSLPLYLNLARRRFREFFADEEFLGLIVMVLITWLLLFLALYAGTARPLDAGRDSAMLAIFAQTTTGYTTTDVGTLAPFAKLVLIVSMAVGGNMGSTAGGVKTLRVLLLARFAQLAVQRLRTPQHAVLDFRLAGQRYGDQELLGTLFYVLLFLGVCLASWAAFLAAGYAPLDSLFEVVSAAGTVGLSTGIASVDLEAPLKILLVLDMLAGRLEIIALLVLFHPRLWVGRKLESL
jgi:trk system potassium uptake protein TrkH